MNMYSGEKNYRDTFYYSNIWLKMPGLINLTNISN